MTIPNPDYLKIKLPVSFAGRTRITRDGSKVMACYDCKDPDDCLKAGACQRDEGGNWNG